MRVEKRGGQERPDCFVCLARSQENPFFFHRFLSRMLLCDDLLLSDSLVCFQFVPKGIFLYSYIDKGIIQHKLLRVRTLYTYFFAHCELVFV